MGSLIWAEVSCSSRFGLGLNREYDGGSVQSMGQETQQVLNKELLIKVDLGFCTLISHMLIPLLQTMCLSSSREVGGWLILFSLMKEVKSFLETIVQKHKGKF